MTIADQIRVRLDEVAKQRASLDDEERRLTAALDALEGKAPAAAPVPAASPFFPVPCPLPHSPPQPIVWPTPSIWPVTPWSPAWDGITITCTDAAGYALRSAHRFPVSEGTGSFVMATDERYS